MSQAHRSAYAKCHCGTAPIELQAGRYEGLAVEDRICLVCQIGVDEEQHIYLYVKQVSLV